jgi:twitching motility protein PilT
MPSQPLTESPSDANSSTPLPPTKELIALLLKESEKVSDIFLSPMRPPEVRANGQILAAGNSGIPPLLPEDTRRIAQELIGHRPTAQPKLESHGSCDFTFFLPRLGRFRVNIFSQRGSYAITLRVIPDPALPTFEGLSLPPQLQKLVNLCSGLVVASGPAGSGKSSTLAAILNRINEEKEVHIVTIEDPIACDSDESDCSPSNGSRNITNSDSQIRLARIPIRYVNSRWQSEMFERDS